MKKVVLVGTGHRGTQAYLQPFVTELKDCVSLCGVYDINKKRAHAALVYSGAPEVPVFDDFDRMLDEVRPDFVVVTTKDCLHEKYVVRALDKGYDVVCEKPLTTDEKMLASILEAEKRSGKKVRVTFNCRFLPVYIRVKEILNTGIIGDIFSVHYEWLLDTDHGADYFRRWHAERKNSGSLLIHKSTHHFDLLNWWLDDEPVAVNAFGTQRFYGPHREKRSIRCKGCPYANECEFYFDIDRDPFYKAIYVETEDDGDHYVRDQCVFGDRIDIEDSVSVSIRYKKGCVVSYSLTAHSPTEGMKIVFNGSKGRLELSRLESGFHESNPMKYIRIYNRMNELITYEFKEGSMLTQSMTGMSVLSKDNLGGHGGSDPVMRAMIFRAPEGTPDPLHQLADTRAGAYSVAIGIASNISMKEHRQVQVDEFLNESMF
ncbi:MAG: Gfo/Idh/MocA family oxidoreductase [Clostridia bacterium]|nr:Gfo/Idh/MocA family oxidoreductase [Clostridia bacterium]